MGITFRNATEKCVSFKARNFSAKKKKKTKAKALLPQSYLQRGSSAFPGKQGLAVQNALQVRTNSAQENYKPIKSM